MDTEEVEINANDYIHDKTDIRALYNVDYVLKYNDPKAIQLLSDEFKKAYNDITDEAKLREICIELLYREDLLNLFYIWNPEERTSSHSDDDDYDYMLEYDRKMENGTNALYIHFKSIHPEPTNDTLISNPTLLHCMSFVSIPKFGISDMLLGLSILFAIDYLEYTHACIVANITNPDENVYKKCVKKLLEKIR